ncbi:MAG TPA: hypothetical protein VF173_01395 [Thermoanaerobaculia bacterium]|nr:hypothetical protein [Thermoanaerobaculia bacterium]
MIAFVTLLLGLISGTYPIEVTVGGPVASVEYVLDGAPVAEVKGPPWTAKVDLGPEIRPRELTVRALDAQGQEIARVTQWLNLPRPPAEVEIVLEKGTDGVLRAAQLTWQSISGVKPTSLRLTLDGQPLRVDGEGRAPLPATNLKVLHVLAAELWFPPGIAARKDVAFGGEYGSEVSTELTAVPVRLHAGTALPPPGQLQGWFAAGGQALPAAAVEDGPGKVIIVRVPNGQEIFNRLITPQLRPMLRRLQKEMRLSEDDGVRFLSLASNTFRTSRVPASLFDMSQELKTVDGGMFWLLTSSRLLKESRTSRAKAALRISDAVAVAGLQAAAENHRRAVVLVLGDEVKDSSRYTPESVRGYLDSVHVPLFVWSLNGPRSPAAKAWSGAEDVSTVEKLEQAVTRLRAELDSQRIVWLEGRHLPQAIALTPEARGVEVLAGRVP